MIHIRDAVSMPDTPDLLPSIPLRDTEIWTGYLQEVASLVSRVVIEVTKISWDQMVKHNRTPEVVTARMLMVTMLDHCGLRCAEIGRLLERDHSTILHAINQGRKSPEMQEALQESLNALGREVHILCNRMNQVHCPADLDWALTARLRQAGYYGNMIDDIRAHVLGAVTGLALRFDPMAARRGQILLNYDQKCHDLVTEAMRYTGFAPWSTMLRDRSIRRA